MRKALTGEGIIYLAELIGEGNESMVNIEIGELPPDVVALRCNRCDQVFPIETNHHCPVSVMEAELDRLRRFAAIVEGFITDRAGYITAIENCAPDEPADYWCWQGHAEARRQLLALLPWPPTNDDAERISKAARVTRT